MIDGGRGDQESPLHPETPEPLPRWRLWQFNAYLLRLFSQPDYTQISPTEIHLYEIIGHVSCTFFSDVYTLCLQETWPHTLMMQNLWLFGGPRSDPFLTDFGLRQWRLQPGGLLCDLQVHFMEAAKLRQLPRKTWRGGPWELSDDFTFLGAF